ncbi:hypothetical protein BV25DRAFT_1913221 [Artomyces pyxidatus]|uniref:Uncharacterized protein n=1 Tax=Artomyces pyxidatus TaxID=48021 RepID=A0ACB8TCF1_9AGAM|nr:hypothetical protein BV25DRAFT_1913221 [Artomyces pyxidatus]
MSGYEKQGGWSSEYAAPPPAQGYAAGGYQQQPQYGQQQPPYGAPQYQQQPYQQGQYQQPPPPGQYQQQPPPGQYQSPPPQGQYQSPPPPGQYGAPATPGQYQQPPPYGVPPPQGQYGAPPPQGQYGAPPPEKSQYGAPTPQGHYGAPPAQGHYGAPPPQGQYGAPSQGQYGAPAQPARHFVTFRFSGTKKTILNSQVHDPYGKTPFTVQSDKKHSVIHASNGSVIAKFDWDHSSPVMEYAGKKMKCKEWIPYHKESGTRKLTFEGKVYDWSTREKTNYFEPSDQPGFPYVVWHDETDEVVIDVYQEALVIPGLLEAAIASIVIMQSGHPVGDVGGSSGGSSLPLFGASLGAALGPMLAGAF